MMSESEIHRRDTEDAEKNFMNGLTEKIIGAAIEVHKTLGPGLLESAYEECLAHELFIANVAFDRARCLCPLPTNRFSLTAVIALIFWSNKRWFWK
jgi:PD-(D/E)XK nuclease superfamily